MTIAASVLTLLPIEVIQGDPSTRWFGARGCVVHEPERVSVFLGGSLIGSYEPRDRGTRNVILVGLAGDDRVHLGKLATAFDVAPETLRLIRAQAKNEGLQAVLERAPGGKDRKVTPAIRRRLETMFEAGLSIRRAHAQIAKRHDLSRTVVADARKQWHDAKAAPSSSEPVASATSTMAEGSAVQQSVPTSAVVAAMDADVSVAPSAAPIADVAPAPSSSVVAPDAQEVAKDAEDASKSVNTADVESEAPPMSRPRPGPRGSDEEGERTAIDDVVEMSPTSAAMVQHVGTWIIIAAVAQLGLYAAAAELRARRVPGDVLRIAMDAVIGALAIGENCVEGVRRLATPSAPTLLRADHAPSASWVRRVLGRFSQAAASAKLHLQLAGDLARSASDAEEDGATVFYVDNHLRPYTGKCEIRKGWRMQDKRVRPGTSDYYVHDEDGRPVTRLAIPEHGSLTQFLRPIAEMLRMALGEEEHILLAFDRAGAFPAQMAELRDAGFAFVTYERRPYPLLAKTAFDRELEIDEEETVRFTESRINLGKGRGRVRRISVLHEDGRQVNLLAVSDEPAERLIGVMAGRWSQENAFKYGVARWGINQLDGRTTHAYPPDTVVPNPARRRLDRAIRIARVREGDALRALATLEEANSKRAPWETLLKEARAAQAELLALRPSVKKKAPLEETELKDKLVWHETEYKMTLDTIRIACANVEADLAFDLAPWLTRGREVKKVLANVFAAPGRVRVGDRTITVDLQPAGTTSELEAIRNWLTEVNARNLTLPGDPERRPLRFRSP